MFCCCLGGEGGGDVFFEAAQNVTIKILNCNNNRSIMFQNVPFAKWDVWSNQLRIHGERLKTVDRAIQGGAVSGWLKRV